MTADLYSHWAPADSPWSAWVKPVLFAGTIMPPDNPGAAPLPTQFPVGRLPDAAGDSFVIVDQPGAAAVALGLALAERGFRPVPLFNGVDGEPAVVPVDGIVRELGAGAARLASLRLPANAPPAFLLDSNRLTGPALPRMFDNRWVVVPEDFPSANRLLASGLRRGVLLLELPLPDLPHVLLRYHAAGIALWEAGDDGALSEHRPRRPSSFRTLFARALVLAGLRRSSAGGFGGLVPVPSEGGYG